MKPRELNKVVGRSVSGVRGARATADSRGISVHVPGRALPLFLSWKIVRAFLWEHVEKPVNWSPEEDEV